MARVILGVTGSVAAIHTPLLFEELKSSGHDVKVVATAASVYFFDGAALSGGPRRDPSVVVLDEDEWPAQAEGGRYARGDNVLHIELRRWGQALVIAPLDANTLAKLALGICDNCLTCVYRAWHRGRRVVLAPAMNTLMWEHPATLRHLRQIAEDMSGGVAIPAAEDALELIAWINENLETLHVVAPQVKRLACDDVGIGAMGERGEILASLV